MPRRTDISLGNLFLWPVNAGALCETGLKKREICQRCVKKFAECVILYIFAQILMSIYMNRTISKYVAMLFLVALPFVTPTRVDAQNNLPQVPYIDINASAQRKVTPDEIYLVITIKESDYKGKKSLQQVQQTMVDVLKRDGVNIDEQLTVLTMGSSVKLKAFSSKIKSLTTAQYQLKLGSAEDMQTVIADLEKKEISNIVLIETKYSKMKELESELGVEAVKNAQQKARLLATAIGQEAGKAIYINTWGMNSTAPARNLRASKMAVVEDAAAGLVDTPATLSIAETEYTVTVNVRFELK